MQTTTHAVRTTIKLPLVVHDRVKAYAQQQGRPLSAVLGDLVTQSASEIGITPCTISVNPRTGFPVISLHLDHQITPEEVKELIDEDLD